MLEIAFLNWDMNLKNHVHLIYYQVLFSLHSLKELDFLLTLCFLNVLQIIIFLLRTKYFGWIYLECCYYNDVHTQMAVQRKTFRWNWRRIYAQHRFWTGTSFFEIIITWSRSEQRNKGGRIGSSHQNESTKRFISALDSARGLIWIPRIWIQI